MMRINGIGESVAQHLRSMILTGELAPGERLNENTLAEILEVSRSPIREAIRTLEKEKIVMIIPRKGAYVTELSLDGLRMTAEAREAVECHAIDLIKLKNGNNLGELQKSVTMAISLEENPFEERENQIGHFHIMADFHVRLVDSTKNDWLISFSKSINNYLARYQFMYLKDHIARETSSEAHRNILSLLVGEHYDEAKKQMRTHIKHVTEIMLENISANTGLK